MNISSIIMKLSYQKLYLLGKETKTTSCKVSWKQTDNNLFTSWLKSIYSTFSLSITCSLYVFITLFIVLYTTSQYCFHFSTWHQLSIYSAGDHLEGQRFYLIWPNLNKKPSKQPVLRFVLYHCKTTLVSSNMLSVIKQSKKDKKEKQPLPHCLNGTKTQD
jgi:hypothetical protein